MSLHYFDFNNAITNIFFDGRSNSHPIYLDLEDELRLEVSQLVSLNPDDFDLELGLAVSKTICWDKANIYEWHVDNLRRWNATKDDSPPPFSALLLTFSLAAEHMRQGDEYSANNYYQRLAELLGITCESRKNKLSAAGKHTRLFWQTLNHWLQRTDFIYGRPTARQVNSWTFVSYSLSQSLVRDGDKKTLQKMFPHYGFTPHQSLNPSEMKLYLNEWMTSSGPSAWLKKLWGNNDLRDRVVDAACSELEGWEGGQFDNPLFNHDTKLTIAIALKKFPRVKVNLYLITTIDDKFGGDSLTISNDRASSQLNAALNNGKGLWLTELPGTRVAYLDPISELNLNALINFSFELKGSKSRNYSHEAKPIIPLIKLEGSTIYREIPKISLFEKHILICHSKWEPIVSNYLDKYARSGYSILNSGLVAGLPLEWVIFLDVEVINIALEDISNNLQCLLPISEGEYIYLTGGLRLGSGVWHTMAPPDVFASNGNGFLDVKIKNNEFIDDLNQDFLDISGKYNPSFLKQIGNDLDSKNLILYASNDGSKIERDISFRSALTPRKLFFKRNAEFFYCAEQNTKVSLYNAEEITDSNKDKPHIRGLSFFGPEPIDTALKDLGEIQLVDLKIESDEDWKTYNLNPIDEDENTCIIRGYHYWIVTPDNTSMTCQGCKQFQIVRKKGRKKTLPPVPAKANIVNTPQHLNEVEKKESTKLSFDIAYDAICYLGSGNWNQIQSILSESVELPWHVAIANQNLVDFGYIDQSLKINRFIPDHWSCSPPLLTITEQGTAFVSGFRNEILIDNVKNALAPITAGYDIIDNNESLLPSSHVWRLNKTELSYIKSLTKEIIDPHGRPIEVQFCSGRLIAESLPLVSEILKALPIIHIENISEIEKFDLKLGKWTISKFIENGAYRTNFAGRRYFYYKNGESREASHELVKLMAARESDIFLHQYNLKESSLECIIGCDPPGLFKRALIACSGIFPEVKNGKTIYTQIPRSLGKLIMYKLYK